ncbi:MAG: A/G-specific adenine glycosylase [Brachymonas sp.]|nr:A/G-specific adenine glycosylase [Brachymonas sp.]
MIGWQRQHGRHGLPWQNTRDPYRVWLSEIMLQQTQVSTVMTYYARFLAQFPTLIDLANASADAVLALWSGLGYYSRARNLHRCAQIVRDEHQGVFPASQATLERLPGIGPSTAAAIAAFCFGERVSIFDGNVQRVLARLLASDADVSRSAGRRSLWQAAQQLLPAAEPAATLPDRMAAYTQGLMDLGATVCLPRQPACQRCPVVDLCRAHAQGRQQAYPFKTGKLKRTSENWWLLALVREVNLAGGAENALDAATAAAGPITCSTKSGAGKKAKPAAVREAAGAVLPAPALQAKAAGRLRLWLQKRPQQGIWGGLHCLPVFASEAALQQLLQQLPGVQSRVAHPAIKHVLTHKDLLLHPIVVRVADDAILPQELAGAWHAQAEWPGLGLPAPVRKWLDASFAPFALSGD